MLHVALLGPGLVGKEVLRQTQQFLHAPPSALQGTRANAPRFPVVRVVAIANSTVMLLHRRTAGQPPHAGIPLDRWQKYFPTNGGTGGGSLPTELSVVAVDYTALVQHLRTEAGESPVLIVDCTSSEVVAAKYVEWLRAGIHIVTPNKKAFSSDLGYWREIVKATARKPGVPYPLCYHESTVGAGLPVLSTLKDLLATGDRVVKIEGIFSGTLSFLFNTFSSPDQFGGGNGEGSNRPFSDIVKEAKDKGYTEPDPRDDLNGMDVARKVVILSRVAGLDLALETLPVENVVPEELRDCKTVDKFMQRLPEADAHFEKLNKQAMEQGQVLRYVGVVSNRADEHSEVALRRYPLNHPFAQLRGSDNIIAFYTERFPRPLIIQGAGAGAAVTAHGVLSDLLKIAEMVCYNRAF